MSGRGAAPSPPAMKPCLVRRNGRREQHGLAAAGLRELRDKACALLGMEAASAQPVTLVLAEDGTVVDDEDYFLCLPPNTAFVALARGEAWACSNTDGGTAWLEGEVTDVDGGGGERWRRLARQLKGDLSTIVLMSEEDLQALLEVRCPELAQELSDPPAQVQALQEMLQQVLDRREEERQSRQLLELYMQAVKSQGRTAPKGDEAADAAMEEADTVDAGGSGRDPAATLPLSSHILAALREKAAPELSLASQDLELVSKEDPELLAQALSWEKPKTLALQEACQKELSRRLQQVQALHSLRSLSKGKKKKLPWGEWLSSKRKK